MNQIEKATEWFRVNGIDTTEVEGKLYVTITLSDGRRTDVQLSDSEVGFRSRQYDQEVSSKTLFDTDYVIYDKVNDHVIQFGNGQVVIFSDKSEAEEDCRGNESVVKCTDLPQHWQEIILKQL